VLIQSSGGPVKQLQLLAAAHDSVIQAAHSHLQATCTCPDCTARRENSA
jgi:hypothetical protein